MAMYQVEIIITNRHLITVEAESKDAALGTVLGDMDYSRQPEDSDMEYSACELLNL